MVYGRSHALAHLMWRCRQRRPYPAAFGCWRQYSSLPPLSLIQSGGGPAATTSLSRQRPAPVRPREMPINCPLRLLGSFSGSVEYTQHQLDLDDEEPLGGDKNKKSSSTTTSGGRTPGQHTQSGVANQILMDADQEWRRRIQAELPMVTEDILAYYDEIGRSEVRTRYRDNVRFEIRLIQSRMRSAHEVSPTAPRSAAAAAYRGGSGGGEEEAYHHHRTPSTPTAASILEEEYEEEASSSPLVTVEDLDDVVARPAEGFETTMVVEEAGDANKSILSTSMKDPNETKVERPLKLMDGTASLVSSYKTVSDEIVAATILLRTITEQEWIEFDYPQEVEQGTSEEAMEDAEDEAEDILSLKDEDSGSSSDPNSDMIDADQVKMDLDRGDRLTMIADRIRTSNKGQLSQDDYNLVLARLAVATELLPDDILTRLVDVFEQMKRFSRPDSTTYEVLLLALGRRFAASPMAASFVMDVTADVAWSAKMFEAAASICEHRNNHQLAQKLLEAMEGSSVWVPKKAYRSLLEFAKIDDRRDFALRIMNHALESVDGINDHLMDKVLATAVRWRTRNKYGRSIDNSDFYLEVLRVMERNASTYRPGYIFWEALIDALSIGAKQSPARWKLVAKAFEALNKERPKYCPSHRLLRNGLEASGALLHPELACSLVCRSMDYFQPPGTSATTTTGTNSPEPFVPMISVKDVAKALEVCVIARNISLCSRILQSVGKAGFSNAGMSELYHIGLNGAAKEGNTEEAERIIVSMQQTGIRPGTKSYVSLMHAYAMAKKLDEAAYLLEALISGETDLMSPAVYDGYILACVRCNAWDRIRTTFDKMKNAFPGKSPSSIAAHGLVLAAHQGPDPSAAKETVDELLDYGTIFNEAAALLSARILIPELCGPELSVASICGQLKAVKFTSDIHRQHARDLHRLLTVASADAARDNQSEPANWNSVVTSMKQLSVTMKDSQQAKM